MWLGVPNDATDLWETDPSPKLNCGLHPFTGAGQDVWDYDSPTWAGKFLDLWCTQVMRSRIEPMKKFAGTIRGHLELLLNYFRTCKQFSSGVIEGHNNEAKVTMRKAYGLRTFRATEVALYHVLGKLPEPPLTHRFC